MSIEYIANKKMRKGRRETARINKEVESLTNVDYSKMRFRMAVLYHNPIDFVSSDRDFYVIRIFDCDRPTNVCARYKSKEAAREDAKNAGFTKIIGRSPQDDIHIVEVYI